jgi:hypothetical protein
MEIGVRRHCTVWVRVAGDQKRNPLRGGPFKKEDGLLGRRAQQIASLKSQTERRSGHLGDEQVALVDPIHIACKYFLRSYAPVGLPSIFPHQVACEHFVTQRFENV